MPNVVIPHARRRRLAVLAAAGAIGVALAPALLLTSSPAVAAGGCVPTGYTATSQADLLRLNLLDVSPLGLVPAPIADVTIGHATADMAHAHANVADARASYLSATLAGITVPAALLNTSAEQVAPPSHAGPDQHSLIKLNSGLLDLGAGNVTAAAGKNGPYGCGIASGGASVLGAAVLPGTGQHSLLALPQNLNGFAGAGLSLKHGRLVSVANAGAGLANLQLLSGSSDAIGVKVITEPTLTGIAGGSVANSSVTYTSPVLDVTLPNGTHVTVDDAHASVDIATSAGTGALTGLLGSLHVPALPSLSAVSLTKAHLEVRLSLGTLTSSITKTSVFGSAATLRVQVFLATSGTHAGLVPSLVTGGKPVLDLGIGELSMAATAPAAPTAVTPTPSPTCTSSGYGCGKPCDTQTGNGYGSNGSPCPTPSPSTPASHPHTPKPSPSTSAAGTTTGKLPLTGTNASLYVGGGVLALVLGRFLMVVARRRLAG